MLRRWLNKRLNALVFKVDQVKDVDRDDGHNVPDDPEVVHEPHAQKEVLNHCLLTQEALVDGPEDVGHRERTEQDGQTFLVQIHRVFEVLLNVVD